MLIDLTGEITFIATTERDKAKILILQSTFATANLPDYTFTKGQTIVQSDGSIKFTFVSLESD
jgi:hypothetical protein